MIWQAQPCSMSAHILSAHRIRVYIGRHPPPQAQKKDLLISQEAAGTGNRGRTCTLLRAHGAQPCVAAIFNHSRSVRHDHTTPRPERQPEKVTNPPPPCKSATKNPDAHTSGSRGTGNRDRTCSAFATGLSRARLPLRHSRSVRYDHTTPRPNRHAEKLTNSQPHTFPTKLNIKAPHCTCGCRATTKEATRRICVGFLPRQRKFKESNAT